MGRGLASLISPPFMKINPRKVSDCSKQFRQHEGTNMSFGVKTIRVVHPLFPILPYKLIPFHDYTPTNDTTFVCEKNPLKLRNAYNLPLFLCNCALVKSVLLLALRLRPCSLYDCAPVSMTTPLQNGFFFFL